jgi:hypothetical protein
MARPRSRTNALDPTDETVVVSVKLPRAMRDSLVTLADMRRQTVSQTVRDLIATAIDRAIAAIVAAEDA